MKLHSVRIALLGVALLGFSNLKSNAQIIPVFQDNTNQPGFTTKDYKFTRISLDNYGAYPSFGTGDHTAQGAWPAPINADGGSLNQSLNRPNTAEYTDFLANSNSGGIYSFMTETTYAVSSTAPLSNTGSLIFQLYQAAGSDGAATNNEYVGLPSLTLTFANSTQQTLSSSAGTIVNSTSATIFGSPTTLNDTSFTFDLSGVTQPIASYTISVTTGMHSILYGADVTEVGAVPEPSTWAMTGLGMIALFVCVRSRRTQLA